MARNQGYGGAFSQMLINPPDPQKIHYLFALRNLKEQWKIMDRKAYFMSLNEERTKSGGASYQGFLNNIEKDAYENAKDTERLEIEAMGLRKPTPLKSLPKPEGPGMEWKLNDMETLTKGGFKGRNFANGKKRLPRPVALFATGLMGRVVPQVQTSPRWLAGSVPKIFPSPLWIPIR